VVYFAAVGIDLGTTFSVVGFNQNGKVTIVSDEYGRNIFPSVVSYLEDGGIVDCRPHRFWIKFNASFRCVSWI
jgi:molecular chaperone DnaK (HSP70)